MDSREQNLEIQRKLERSEAVNLITTTLTVGDFIVGNIVLERKTVYDFYNSIKDNRLEKQTRNLLQLKEEGVDVRIILEGDISILVNGNKKTGFKAKMRWNYLRKILTTIEFGKGIPIVRTNNALDTANLLISISQYGLSDNKNALPIVMKNVKADMSDQEKAIYFLTAFKGIGQAGALTLLKKAENLFDAYAIIYSGSFEEIKELQRFKKPLTEAKNTLRIKVK